MHGCYGFHKLGPSAACPLPFTGPYYARGQGNWGSKGGDASGDGRKRLGFKSCCLEVWQLGNSCFFASLSRWSLFQGNLGW